MPSVSVSTVRSTRTTAEQPTLGPDRTRTASRNTARAADAGRPRVPEAAKAAGRESDRGRSDGGSGGGRVPAGTNGLVICAKSVRNAAAGGVEKELSAADALGLRFPSPDLVASAAALFERAVPWADGRGRLGMEPESGRFRITVGPGVVRLGWARPVRAEKASERAVNHHRLDVAAEGDRIKTARDTPKPHRRAITEWSRKSRAAMCRTFAELDYTPLVECGRVPAMVTLTYPGEWESVAPDGASVKRHMLLWRKRFQREWGEPARYIWKLEFQRRGAPHVHLWMAPPHAVGRSGRNFRDWLSQEWADIVSHPDPDQRARHLLAGTAIDVLNGLRACDPKRLAIYFTKHSSPDRMGSKEYQHIVPVPWRQPGHGPGRFWGVHGLRRAVAVPEIPQNAYLTARRIMRRWSRSQVIYGDCTHGFPTAVVPRATHVVVRRVQRQTGKVRTRRVRRRRLLCSQGGLPGGYALVNDGPAFASQLAAALSAQLGNRERAENAGRAVSPD
ncbi:rolling circle replication-associated protein [Mycobacterium marinum]|uniref:rolling circle replication-associated protein n=1 Tax=Mycobacterium marinum TaxID=1781 RepID=UPI003B430028